MSAWAFFNSMVAFLSNTTKVVQSLALVTRSLSLYLNQEYIYIYIHI